MPWIFVPDASFINQMRLPKAIFFDFVCMAIIASAFIQGTKFSYKNKWFGTMFLIIMGGFFFNWYLPYMVQFEGKRVLNLWNITACIHVILAFVASYMAMSSLDRASYIRIAKAVCLSAVLVSCFGILQAIGFDPMKNITTYKWYEGNHVAAILDHPNMVGNFLALSIPFFLFFDAPIFAVGIGVCCLCLYFTHSSMSFLALFISTMFYFIIKNVRSIKWLVTTIAVSVIGLIIVMSVPSFNKIASGFTGRMDAWRYAIERIKDNPVFGQGVGKFAMLDYTTGIDINGNNGMRWEFVHNDYIEMVINVGFLGLVIFAFLVLNTFKNFNLAKENTLGFSYLASMIAFMVLMFGSFPMEYAPSGLLGMIAFWGSEKL